MQINISGKHLDVGASLQEYVREELKAIIDKYFEQAVSANVTFTKVRHLFVTDIVANEGTGNHILIKGSAEENDVYASFDLAAARIEKQLRRYKRRIKDHHKSRIDKSFEQTNATKYVLSPAFDLEEGSQAENDEPLIIAEKATEIETLTVSDAVMRMDLGQLPALLFRNQKTGAINVVYRREDGNISWIDSSDRDILMKTQAA